MKRRWKGIAPAKGAHGAGEMVEHPSGVVRRYAMWLSRDSGATAVEYALMVGLIAVVIVGSVALFGGGVRGLFEQGVALFK